MIDYQLHRSKRKTVSISINKQGEVDVRAPLRLSKKLIDQFVLEKQDWIMPRVHATQQRLEQKQNFILQEGTMLTVLGKQYPLHLHLYNEGLFDGQRFLLPKCEQELLKSMMVSVYKKIAYREILVRVSFYADKMSLQPTAVKINSAVRRWGSCSGKNSLNFSWRLVVGELDIVDYVVVHELAHIAQHNHSHAFYQLVEQVLPDYRLREQKLHQLYNQLESEGWNE